MCDINLNINFGGDGYYIDHIEHASFYIENNDKCLTHNYVVTYEENSSILKIIDLFLKPE